MMPGKRSLTDIRNSERQSHMEVYATHRLYEPGSWLAKPVKTVLDTIPLLDRVSSPRILDLGCGVGRNAIAVARHFQHPRCQVDCVDLLEYAIEQLYENAARFGVSDSVRGILSSIDEFEIPANTYDLILAVSALEHVDTAQTFHEKLNQIRNGLKPGGIVCLIINSGVTERDHQTGACLPPQFEVNLSTESMQNTLSQIFNGFTLLKSTVVHQKYTVPRASGQADIDTDVVTLVAQKTGI